MQIGELTLSLPDLVSSPALDIDPVTSLILATGNRVQVFWGGALKVTARIKQVEVLEFVPCTLRASKVKVLLTDKLDIALGVESKQTPLLTGGRPVVIGGQTVMVVPWQSRVTQLIGAVTDLNGDRLFADGDILTAGLPDELDDRDENGNPVVDGFSAPSSSGASLVARAAKVAALRGYCLYCDEFEQVRFVRNPSSLSLPAAVISLACSAVEVKPAVSLIEPASAVEVTSSTLKVVINKVEWPKVIETVGPIPSPQRVSVDGGGEELPQIAGNVGVIEREVRNRPVVSTNEWRQSIRITKRHYLANPDLDDTRMALMQVTQLQKQFDAGRYLRRLKETSIEARTLQDKEAFPNDFGMVLGSNRIVEYQLETRIVDGESKTYFKRSVERLLRRKFTRQGNAVSSSLLEERLITEWSELGRNSWRGRKRRLISRGLVLNTLDYGLVPDPAFNAQEEFAEAPPEPPVREPDEEVKLSSSSVLIRGGGTGKTRHLFIEGQSDPAALAKFGQNNLLAEQLYRVQMDVQRQVYDADTTLPLLREDIDSRALVRDGVRVEWGDGTLTYGYTGYLIANLPAAIEPQYPPTYSFDVPPTTLTVGPYSLVRAEPGAQTLPLPLAAYGGTPPYSFSVPDAPGAGVFISGGTLTVSGLPAGSYTFTLRVTDGAGDVAETPISVSVGAAPVSPIYVLPVGIVTDGNQSADQFAISQQVAAIADANSSDDYFSSARSFVFDDQNASTDAVSSLAIDEVVAGEDIVMAGPDSVVVPSGG